VNTTVRVAVDVVLALVDGTTPEQGAADFRDDIAHTASLAPGDEVYRAGMAIRPEHLSSTVVSATWWTAHPLPDSGPLDPAWLRPITDRPSAPRPPLYEPSAVPVTWTEDDERRARAERMDVLHEALAGLALTPYERRVLWMFTGWEPGVVAVVASLLHRRAAAPRTTAARPASPMGGGR
jgi:hypothetical protein